MVVLFNFSDLAGILSTILITSSICSSAAVAFERVYDIVTTLLGVLILMTNLR